MEEKIICNKEDLVAIADATRNATGSTDTYSVSELSEAAVEIISSGGVVGSKDAVLYTEQSLTYEQRAQARKNIGAQTIIKGAAGQIVGFDENGNPVAQEAPSGDAVLFTEQELTEEQQEQTRQNIGAQAIIKGVAGQVVGFDENGNPVAQAAPSGGGGGESAVSTDAVLYTEQSLTDEQKTQARVNIGAGTPVTIDTALTTSGAAADAKVTGTKITTAQSTANNAQAIANNANTTANSANTTATNANSSAKMANLSAYMAMPGSLKWNGTIGDREYVVLDQSELLIALVHVSDTIPMMLAETCFISMATMEGTPSQYTLQANIIPNEDGSYIVAQGAEVSGTEGIMCFVAPADNFTSGTLLFPKKGVYFLAYSYKPLGIDFSLANVSGLKVMGTSFSESCPMESRFETETKVLQSKTIGTTITWDGTTDGHETISFMGIIDVVRLADCTLSYEELAAKTITGTITLPDGTVVEPTSISVENLDNMSGIIMKVADGTEYEMMVAHVDNAVLEVLVLPKAGFYCINQGSGYISSFSLGDYTFTLSQTETSTYLKNEHLSILETASGNDGGLVGDTLTWDGKYDGLDYLEDVFSDTDTQKIILRFVRISDSIPTIQEGDTCTYIMSDGKEYTVSWAIGEYGASIPLNIYVVCNPNGDFTQSGIYVVSTDITDKSTGTTQIGYIKSLTIPNSNLNSLVSGKGKSVIKYEYLPEALQFGEMYAYGDTITWDGDTTGLANTEGILYHVSDTVLTIDDFANGASITVTAKQEGSDPVNETVSVPAEAFEVQDNGIINLEFYVTSIPHNVANEMGVPAGIYFIKAPNGENSIVYTSSFTLPNSDKLHGKTIVKIDPKYLPDGYGSGSGSTGGGVVEETDPTVPAWAKAATKPTYTASEIGAGTFTGQVIANSSAQTPSTSLLRNSKLVSTDTNPTVNGEIYWTYK